MKLSLNWLKEYVGINISPEELADKLTLATAEVEEVEYLGKSLENVVVGEILEIEKHPNADRLRVTKTKVGEGKVLQIVCGAPNIEVGQKVPVALIGAVLPGDFAIKKSAIRGVESEGMICAEDEIGLGGDHSGIMVLNPSIEIGRAITEVLGLDDYVLTIDNKSLTHRADLFCHIGIAREVAAVTSSQLKTHDLQLFPERIEEKKELRVEVEDGELCPRYMACVLDGVEVKESPDWMKNRLRAVGLRPINNIVDITNYILFEYGQPLHAFDADKLGGGDIVIKVRRAKSGEKILALDGKEYELGENNLIIADSQRPVAIAGVMGGEETAIGAATKTIVIESANFHPASVRRTAWGLGLHSDSSLRFEKGLHVGLPEEGLRRAIELVGELSGGKLVSRIGDVKSPLAEAKLKKRKKVLLGMERLARIMGMDIGEERAVKILESLNFQVEKANLPEQLAKLAAEQIGKAYKYGASTFLEAPEAFDCSSFVRHLYWQIGMEIPRMAVEQIEGGAEVGPDSLRPGDLLFARGKSPRVSAGHPEGIGHVGIYVGNGQVVHAKESDGKVVAEDAKIFLDSPDFRGARRMLTIEEGLLVTAPIFRGDIGIEEDLIEEVSRVHGYGNISPMPVRAEVKPVALPSYLIRQRKAREALSGLGFDEIYNYSFYGENLLKKSGLNLDDHNFQLISPLNPDQRWLRVSLRPQICQAAERNGDNFERVKIFEIGRVYPAAGEKIVLGGAIIRRDKERYAGDNERSSAKGAVELLLAELGAAPEDVFYRPSAQPLVFSAYRVRGLDIFLKGVKIGVIEALDYDNIDKKLPLAECWELDLDAISAGKKSYRPIPAYPAIARDFAFVVDREVKYGDLASAAGKVSPLVAEVNYLNVFASEELGRSKKSLAFSVVFRSPDRTLASAEADEASRQIMAALQEKFNAEIRR